MARDSDEDVADALLDYLAECPDAMDTPRAITDWWVMRQQVRIQVETVARVLNKLVERGLLEQVGTGDERRYRRKLP